MIRVSRKILLFLIILLGILLVYMSIIRPRNSKNIIFDSFGFASLENDTVIINYPLPEKEIKDILFLILTFSSEFGGEGFSISSIENGGSAFGRKFEIKDSFLIYSNHKIAIGESFEDTQQIRSLKNIFKTEKNKLEIKNEGLIKAAKITNLFADQLTILSFSKPLLLITGNSHSSYSLNPRIMTLYKSLPYVLIFLGFIFWLLGYVIKQKQKQKHNH